MSAGANGGPVDYTTATAEGGLTPLTHESITLEREDLSVLIDDDAKHYRVEATYALMNPGAPRSLSYGVPLVWVDEENPDGSVGQGGALPSTVDVRVDGHAAGRCRFHPGPVSNGPAAVEPPGENFVTWSSGWCVTDLEIPAGKTSLTLRYRGELRFLDMEFSKSALRSFEPRTLVYPLFPAGYWRGPVKRLVVRVDTGAWGRWVKVEAPAGATRKGSTFSWDLHDVDLTKVRELRLTIDARPLLRSRELAHWNTNHAASNRVEASSQLESGSRYAPNRMLDGKLDTAWC